MILKSAIYGIVASAILLFLYFSVVTFISGGQFAVSQFSKFWYFIVSLAIGFGVQVGLYNYLKSIVHQRNASSGVLALSGTTSTAAMLSCCSHYLVTVLPILGAAGFISLISQYQIQLFWVGLLFNAAGTIYLVDKIIRLRKT